MPDAMPLHEHGAAQDFVGPDPDGEADGSLAASGLFDAEWYAAVYGAALSGQEPFAHFCAEGWRAGYRPNPYFDPLWYAERHLPSGAANLNPLLHFWREGERAGCRPVPYFDPAWYRSSYGVPPEASCLAHFLDLRRTGTVSPLPEFDARFYLDHAPDVAAAGIDPFEHYLHQGHKENRRPSAAFDGAWYRARHMGGNAAANPLLHFLRQREAGADLPTAPPRPVASIAREVRRNAAPGPLFEPRRTIPAPAGPRAKVLAFYLPQFHPIPENDLWWGAGFTEWTNVARGLPRFAGHYQPRIPGELGHYSLDGPETLRRQAAMARAAGIAGFVFYFYRFNTRRLLEKPLEALLADCSIDLPFCLMWANENWTRSWDGSNDEVLIRQEYRDEDESSLLADFARHFADPRYIRLQGRPVLMIYRPGLIPDTAATLARWRERFRAAHRENPVLVMAQSFDARDPREWGMDAAVEFPPHKLSARLRPINDALHVLDPDFAGQVYDYEDAASASLAEPAPDYPLIKTAVPGWDNDARRQGAGLALHGATPARFQAWLGGLIRHANRHKVLGEALVCVNAWNEWAEGAYLEPDRHFGAAFLNAAARAIAGLEPAASAGKLLLVGHDALRHGSQLLLLHLARQLVRVHGVEIAILLIAGGPLETEYRALATTVLAPDFAALSQRAAEFREQGFRAALVNSAAASPAGPALDAAGIGFTLLVHELPGLLHEKGLTTQAVEAANLARDVVFAAPCVRDRFLAATGAAPARTRILPQGIYRPVRPSPDRRQDLRARLGVTPDEVLALGLGYADLRKGFDLFLQLARQGGLHLLWIGGMDPGLRAYLGPQIEAARHGGRFHLLDHRDDAADWLVAADVHLLASREDPFPSVVLEAMSAGVPTVAFEGSGGIPDLLAEHGAGASVPIGDVAGMAARAAGIAREFDAEARARLAGLARARFDFAGYAAELLRLAHPGCPRISVVVPNHDYARFLRQRLGSVFAQTCPVHEVLLLDDASADDSLAVARAAAAEWGREIRVVANDANSGSVFAQWRRAAELARGDWLWIAEADDAAEPRFLETLAGLLAEAADPVLAFTDSRAIDADGNPLAPDHKAYYRGAGTMALDTDGVFAAREFLRAVLAERNLVLNASAVLWRRDAFLEALRACEAELGGFRLAGDWRVLVELLDRAEGQVVYAAEPLNLHRRHAGSVTGRLDPARHLEEIARVHRLLRVRLPGEHGLAERQDRVLREAAEHLGLAKAVSKKRSRKGPGALPRPAISPAEDGRRNLGPVSPQDPAKGRNPLEPPSESGSGARGPSGSRAEPWPSRNFQPCPP